MLFTFGYTCSCKLFIDCIVDTIGFSTIGVIGIGSASGVIVTSCSNDSSFFSTIGVIGIGSMHGVIFTSCSNNSFFLDVYCFNSNELSINKSFSGISSSVKRGIYSFKKSSILSFLKLFFFFYL